MIDEKKVYEDFEEALLEALENYKADEYISYEALTIFIEDKVWESTVKYNRMINVTKEKFFENLYNNTPLDEYTKGITELWNIDHSYMDQSIKELEKMVMQKDLYEAQLYGKQEITKRSIKLQNSWEDYQLIDKELYPLHPDRDFKILEQRYVNRHLKLYKTIQERFKNSPDIADKLVNFMKNYDKLDKTIPYYYHYDKYDKEGNLIHRKGEIMNYQNISTYENMLYNVNLTRSAWNRAIYDAKLLGNHLWYLPAHTFSCPHCAFYQGYVYTDHQPTQRELEILSVYGKPGYYYKRDAIEDYGNTGLGIGHPNCKHVWVSYWSDEQVQSEKYNSTEWKEKYENKQKIQSLTLEKSRLLTDRRIYKELGQQDLYDKTTEKIKSIREKIKELE